MEKVYLDPNSGYTYGSFPKATVDITRTYNCPSPQIVRDTTSTDSVMVDSTDFTVPETPETVTPVVVEPEVKKEEKKQEPVQNQPAVTVPLTKKEERELRRKQRQEEKEKKKIENNQVKESAL